MKRRLPAALLLLVAAGAAGAAESAAEGAPSIDAKGSLSAIAWSSDPSIHGHHAGVGLRGQLELRARAGDWTGFARGDAATGSALASSNGRNRLREAWARYRGESYDLTLGRQLMPTGRTDVIVLQDQFAPRDMTQLATLDDVERQLGVLAARLDGYVSDDLTITGALMLQDQGTVLPRALGQALPPGENLASSPAAAGLLRLEYRGDGHEFAATASSGVSPFPGLSVDRGYARSVYPTESRLALDGSVSIGGDILRWDLVFATDDATGMPGFSRRRRAFALGWDRGLWRDANLSVQLIARRDDLEQPQAAAVASLATLFQANSRLSQAYGGSQQYLTLTFKQRLRTEHEFETGLLLGNHEQFGFVQRWSWQLREGYALQARAQFVRGGDGVLLGNLGFRNYVFVALTHQF